MIRTQFARALGLAALAALALAAPAQATDLFDTSVTSAEAGKRVCHARPAEGAAGVAVKRVTAPVRGTLRAELSAASGDWDLGVFDARTGDYVAGAAGPGPAEVASGPVTEGQALIVQACRRSGTPRTASLSAQVVPAPPPSGGTAKLVRVSTPTRASKRKLQDLGLDVTEHGRDTFLDVVTYGAADEAKLRGAGFQYAVEVPDLARQDLRQKRADRAYAAAVDDSPFPSGRTGYRNLADYESEMKALAEKNPRLVRLFELPNKTYEGRTVKGVEITEDVTVRDGKPVFLQMGVHHAREWPSAEMPMEWAIELLKSYKAGEARAVDLLSKTRVIMVPVINVDGFNLSREAPIDSLQPVVDPSFAYKRRNCRVLDFAMPAAGECGLQANRNRGVDPNRNYGGFWGGGGASFDPSNDTYRGAGPFSEPESQNVRELVSSRQVTTLITNHTYSDLVLRPPGLKSQGSPPDEPIYKDLGDTMAAENGYTSQKSWELYDTTGTTEDWSYYATGGLGFTFEIGKAYEDQTLVGVGFHPAYPLGVVAEYYGKYPTGGGNREAYFKALESTADTSRHAILEGTAQPGSRVRLHKEFESSTSPVIQPDGSTADPIRFPDVLDTTLTVPASGRFEWHVNPSTRPIVRKESRTSETQPTPAQTIDISSAEPALPPTAGGSATVGTKDFEFDVTPEAARQIRAQIDGADGDDYDLYLYKGSKSPDNVVASSTSSTADETIAYDDPEPGHYVLSVQNWLASGGWTGTLEVFGSVPGTEVVVPAGIESWTVTCTKPNGKLAGTEQIVVDRGQRKAVTVCKSGGKQPR
jgi:hypothetical protein